MLGLGALVVRRSAFYRSLVDHEVSANRIHAIDGLRGYLALGVVLHHFVINFQYYQTGVWELTPSRLNTFFGRGSVGFFFMINKNAVERRPSDDECPESKHDKRDRERGAGRVNGGEVHYGGR